MLSGENERDTLVPLKYNVYTCGMKTVILINMIVAYLTIISAILIGVSLMILKHFPKSKLSGWIRRNFITDQDLDPIKREPLEKGLLEDDVLEPPLS